MFLTEHRGADGFTLPVAVKLFAPNGMTTHRAYDEAMARIAQVCRPRGPDPAGQPAGRAQLRRPERIRMMEMEWVDGFDLRHLLSRETLARVKDRVSVRRWDVHQQRDRDGRAGAAAVQAGHRHRHRPRMPGGPGRPASRGHRARRHQAVEHHAQADGQRQDHRHRLGLRDGRSAADPHLHADLRRARSAGRRRMHAAQRPGHAGLRADRDALRPAAVRGLEDLPRPAGSQTVAAPAAAHDPARRSRLQRVADELLPRPDRPRPAYCASPMRKRPRW